MPYERIANARYQPSQHTGRYALGGSRAGLLALAAEGVNMGTRFVCTQEAPVHQRLIDDIPTCGELVERTATECRAHLRRAISWVGA